MVWKNFLNKASAQAPIDRSGDDLLIKNVRYIRIGGAHGYIPAEEANQETDIQALQSIVQKFVSHLNLHYDPDDYKNSITLHLEEATEEEAS